MFLFFVVVFIPTNAFGIEWIVLFVRMCSRKRRRYHQKLQTKNILSFFAIRENNKK